MQLLLQYCTASFIPSWLWVLSANQATDPGHASTSAGAASSYSAGAAHQLAENVSDFVVISAEDPKEEKPRLGHISISVGSVAFDYSLRRALDVAAAPMFAHQRGNVLELLPFGQFRISVMARMCGNGKDSELSKSLLKTNSCQLWSLHDY